jgi:5-methylcytosine-specific restriction endonuclease McrA
MSDCLLLNSNYEPISILPLSVIGWQHALKLYFLDRVTILESYDDWVIRSEHLTINVPSVLVTKEYFDNKKHVKFSRYNMYLRDLFQCQYCGDTFDGEDLTIDHVLPRASGGKTNWENCCTACKPCNYRKGHKLQKPLRMPFKPDYYGLVNKWKTRPVTIKHESWHQYLGVADTRLVSRL